MSVSPWHQLCTLRDDVRTGKLTLAEFAADLNGVRTGEAPPVYREPALFFARTFPTWRMKLLARDVLLRLAGQGGKPVLQLQVAYGGGKIHTLIALLHLAEWSPPSPAHERSRGLGEGEDNGRLNMRRGR
jgi:predicted AAA+ superfamily ATPase